MIQEHLIHPEWDPIAELWVGWPTLPSEWGEAFESARSEIAKFIEQASHSVDVKVLGGSEEALISAVRATAGTGANVVPGPMGDIWLRDTGPIFTGTGHTATASIFEFNGWGGRFLIAGDKDVASFITANTDLPEERFRIVLEGGSIDLDGAGHLLTTRQCLLNSNRNPALSQIELEEVLQAAFGVETIIWLEDGLCGDHTDGHIDNLARFIGPGHVLCQHPTGMDDPNANVYQAAEAALRAAGLKVSSISSPGLIQDAASEVMPASHMNFVFLNDTIIMPIYDDETGAQAAEQLASILPQWKVQTLSARAILTGGGAFHCMTCHVPKALFGE